MQAYSIDFRRDYEDESPAAESQQPAEPPQEPQQGSLWQKDGDVF